MIGSKKKLVTAGFLNSTRLHGSSELTWKTAIYMKTYKTSGKGGLHIEKIEKLQFIGVSLEPYSTHWNGRFQILPEEVWLLQSPSTRNF